MSALHVGLALPVDPGVANQSPPRPPSRQVQHSIRLECGMRNALRQFEHISILIQLWKGNVKPAAAFGQAPFAMQQRRCPLIGRSRTATGWRGREEGGELLTNSSGVTAKWWSKLIQCFSCFKAFRLVNADIQERPARPSTRQNFKPGDWTCPVLNVEVLKAEGTNLKFRVWEVWYLFYMFYISSETPRVISSLLKQSMFESWLRSRLWWPRITIWVGMKAIRSFEKWKTVGLWKVKHIETMLYAHV